MPAGEQLQHLRMPVVLGESQTMPGDGLPVLIRLIDFLFFFFRWPRTPSCASLFPPYFVSLFFFSFFFPVRGHPFRSGPRWVFVTRTFEPSLTWFFDQHQRGSLYKMWG